ncbi:DNA polymerase III subunit gamma/tau [Paucibacter sp. PLA-PC-4]|uniref:DNA polymerase III subunit gamma/tau n=1 Tax=Paucibacter sp. PLA-PC-4 TaxID=2993655 RepID=UPI002249978E|nr:DNA polymerase III subunit gamma/tau [Paucibacter sp. PLA-PC-4]MCX2862725.1 DNA polymerase III subunit gamma/tau [Paucibacter sp. PLA-PC-4]
MSYQVLARKYRPHSFEELRGQEHVVQALANALTQQRLHHAYLFTGTRGVGKTTVSRILAKSLNCTGADGQGTITAQPCGVCEACRDIDAGRFVDYVELDAASNRGVEEISQLLDQSVYKPVVGRFKVYMIDEVHMLSNTAFNAMLKTLEEPPDYLKFVLATTDPQKVPVTVLSRCLQFNLRPMAPQTVLSHLSAVLEAEHVAADAGALRLLARAARGSMRDALSLTDQAIAFGAGALVEAGVRQMLGTVDRGHVVAILDALVAADGAAVVAQADGLRSLGLSAAGTLEDLATLLQQTAVAQAAPKAVDDQDPDSAEARRLAGLLPADEIQLMYSMALHGRQELGLAPDEYAGLTMVLLRMLAFRPGGVSTNPVLNQAPTQPRKTEPVPASAPLLRPTAPSLVVRPPEPKPSPALEAASAPATEPATEPVSAPPPSPVAVELREPTPPTPTPQAPPMSPRAQAEAGSLSARLRPRPVVIEERGEADEPPPWLDAPPADEESGAVAQAGDDDSTESGESAGHGSPGGAYASTAGSDVQLSPTPLGERWAGIVKRLSLVALARELALQAECVVFDEQAEPQLIRLKVERESLRQPALKDKLQAALAALLERPVAIEVESGVAQDSPSLRDAAQAQAIQRQTEQFVFQDPLVQQLLAQFKTARIVPGSIKPH